MGPVGRDVGWGSGLVLGRGGDGETSGRSPRAPCAMPWSVNFSICGGGRLL